MKQNSFLLLAIKCYVFKGKDKHFYLNCTQKTGLEFNNRFVLKIKF